MAPALRTASLGLICLALLLGAMARQPALAASEDEVRATFERYVAAHNAHVWGKVDGPRGLGFQIVQGKLERRSTLAADTRAGSAGPSETFQWIETFTGELILMSLSTHRYLRLDAATGTLRADSPGPHPNGRDGVRWDWRLADRGGSMHR